MATRAVIITIDNRIMTSTYNHYDGYPDYLGKVLSTHYNSDELAKKISGEGYISYIDDETGEVNVSNPRDKEVKPTVSDFGGMDVDDMAYELAKDINAAGADYAYIWNQRGDNWVTVKNDGIKSTMNKLADELPTMGFDNEQDMMEEKDYMTEWKSFLNEESFFKDDATTIRWEKVRDNAYRMLKNEPGTAVNDYVDALERQITKMPSDLDMMIDWEADDFLNDFRDWETRYL
jgi:hypothetical protein